MRCVRLATVVAVSSLVSFVALGQSTQLSITDYQCESGQPVTATLSSVTCRAAFVNTGVALASVIATVGTTNPFSVRVVPGKDVLNFGPVPANSQVTSSNTFTILVDRTQTFSFGSLQWTFQSVSAPPVANAGPNLGGIAPGTTVTLDGSGSTNPSGIGTLTYTWMFTSRPAGTTAILSNPASVTPTFVPDVPGATWVITLTVSNGVASSSSSVTISSNPRIPPVANPGPNQIAFLGATVVLDGSGSTSGSGKPLTYSWILVSRPAGSLAVLMGANTVSPTFVADKPGTYVAELVVSDGFASSGPADVTITDGLLPPVANAGSAQQLNFGSPVQLDGSGSTDADGWLPLTFQWSLITVPAGSTATLSNPTVVNPAFIPDILGNYVAQLIVTDTVPLSSVPATVLISVAPVAPTVNAGPNQNVPPGTLAQLNCIGTELNNPPQLPLTFQWALISTPTGSAATLSSTSIANPTFVPDISGNYVAQCTVTNAAGKSSAATVMMSTTCGAAPPTANPGSNQNVLVGDWVTLNGGDSADPCRDAITYSWSFTTIPVGSAAKLSGATTASPSFVPDVPGPYVAQLIVNNGFTSSSPATVTINAFQGRIFVPTDTAVGLGQLAVFPVTLSAPARSSVTVYLTSSDASKVSVPAYVTIAAGATTPAMQPLVKGVAVGSAAITAAVGTACVAVVGAYCPHYTSGTGTVMVSSMAFSGSPLTINAGGTGTLTLNLSGEQRLAGGLTVNLSSSNTSVATVPASVTFAAGATSAFVTVKGVAVGGPVTITASSTGFMASATAIVNVGGISPSPNVSVPNVSVGQNLQVNLTLTLASPAPAGGLNINVTSSDTTKVLVAGRATDAGAAQVTVAVPASATQISGIYVQGLVNNGTATLVATGVGLFGSGTVTLTPSGFTLSPSSITTYPNDAASTLTVTPTQLDAAGNILGYQPLRGGATASVTIANSNPSAGSVTSPVTINGGDSSDNALYIPTSTNAGATILTAVAAGYSTLNSGNSTSITITGGPPGCASVTVGNDLETTTTCSLRSAVSAPTTVVVTSGNSSQLRLSTTGTDAGAGSISVIVPAGLTTTPPFYVYGLANTGSVSFTAVASGYASGTATVSLAPSGFVLASPDGIGHRVLGWVGTPIPITVLPAQLDSSGNFVAVQALAGSASAVTITVNNSNSSAGAVNPTQVTIAPGSNGASTSFVVNNTTATSQVTNLTIGTPAGFSTPVSADTTITVGKDTLTRIINSCDGTSVGQNLQESCTMSGPPSTVVTITSNSPNLLLALNAANPGSASITITIPAGGSASYFLQSLGSPGTATITTAVAGLTSVTSTITLLPSGVVMAGPFGLGTPFFLASLSGGTVSFTVYTAALNADASFNRAQALRGGIASLSITLNSSNPGVGSISSPVTILGGSGSVISTFTPLSPGLATVSVNTPSGGYVTPSQSGYISVSGTVVQ